MSKSKTINDILDSVQFFLTGILITLTIICAANLVEGYLL